MTNGLATLKKEIAELQDRIRRLEADVKCPLDADFSEQAGQITDRSIRMRLIEIEKENLARREEELKSFAN